MQDRYAGDVGDYSKVQLLTAIQAQGFSVGINWYKVSELDFEKNADGSYKQDDGKHRAPDELKDARSISDVELFLPGIVFFGNGLDEEVPIVERDRWHERALSAFKGIDVVFLDPDNGLRCKSVKENSKRSVKYVLHKELSDYIAKGKTIIVYNHRCRKKEDKYFSDIFAVMEEYGVPYKKEDVLVVTFRKGTIRDYLVFPDSENAGKIKLALETLYDGDAWSEVKRPAL